MKSINRFLLLALCLFAVVAQGDSTVTGGARVIENPTQDGNLVMRVNDGGVKKDVITVTGSTGAVALQASGSTDTVIVNGSLQVANTAGNKIVAANGSTTVPAYTFQADGTMGISRSNSNIIDLIFGSVKRHEIGTSYISVGEDNQTGADGAGSIGRLFLSGNSSSFTDASINLRAFGGSGRGGGLFYWNDAPDTTWFWGVPYSTGADEYRLMRKTGTTSLNEQASDPTASTTMLKMDNTGILSVSGVQLTGGPGSNVFNACLWKKSTLATPAYLACDAGYVPVSGGCQCAAVAMFYCGPANGSAGVQPTNGAAPSGATGWTGRCTSGNVDMAVMCCRYE